MRLGYGRIAEAMAARGDSLEIVTPGRFPRVSRVHARWYPILLPFAAAWWLWRRRRAFDVALFHSYTGWVFNLATGGLPTVTAFHGLEPLWYAAEAEEHRARGARLSWRFRFVHGWLMPRLLRLSCRRSARVTCVNSEEAEYLRRHRWTTPERLVVLKHGVPDFFFADDRAYAPRACHLIFASQWISLKGIHALVPAFTALARERRDLELVCAGTRTADDAVRAAFPADVRAQVHNHPEMTQLDMAAAYRGADIFVHASVTEAYGRSIAEAMAGGLPIVTTRVGVVIDLLADGRDAVIVPKSDAGALEAALRRLLDDRALRARLGQAARQQAATLRASERDRVVANLLCNAAAARDAATA